MNRRKRTISFTSLMTLAFWLLRQTWGMLLVIGLGVLLAITLVCAIPLYSEVAATAGLHHDLLQSSQRADITASSDTSLIKQTEIDKATALLQKEIQHTLNDNVVGPQFSVHTNGMNLSPLPDENEFIPLDNLNLTGIETASARSHLKLSAGRYPEYHQSNDNNAEELEFMLSDESARALYLQVGSERVVWIFMERNSKVLQVPVTLRLVGTFVSPDVHDPYWHNQKFVPAVVPINALAFVTEYPGIATNEALLHFFERKIGSLGPDTKLNNSFQINWYYRLNVPHLSALNLADVAKAFNQVKVDTSYMPIFSQPPVLQNFTIYTDEDPHLLDHYLDYVSLNNLPVLSILLLIICFVLFFVSTLASLLMERQADTIVLLQSRGASRWQIIFALLLQGSFISVLALILAPWLAFLCAGLLGRFLLSSADREALRVLSQNGLLPVQAVTSLIWLPVLVLVAVILTIAVSFIQATAGNVLTRKRARARSRSLNWLRNVQLDVLAMILAGLSFAVSYYITHMGVLTQEASQVLLPPLTLFQIVSLALMFLLLLIRLFTWFLQFLASRTAKSRGATLQLALTHMSRAPQEPVRMSLLFALAIAFALFALTFVASQQQRIQEIAAYRTGADFSGTILAGGDTVLPSQLQDTISLYKQLPGVLSASLGYSIQAIPSSSGSPINFLAVDSETFAQTADWQNGQVQGKSLPSLMQALKARRSSALQAVPAILDNATWQRLDLSRGKIFIMRLTDAPARPIVFEAMDTIGSLPTLDNPQSGGMLVDYSTFIQVYRQSYDPRILNANTAWLRTSDNPIKLQQLRQELTHGRFLLDPLHDRRAIQSSLTYDPSYADLLGVMLLGAGIALFLAFISNLTGAWFRAHLRQTNFAVLRALGATPIQITTILSWEQAFISLIALLVGAVLAAALINWMLPALMQTNVALSSVRGSTQASGLPVHIVVPLWLLLILAGIVLLGLFSLFAVTRNGNSSLGQRLRLNED